MSDFFLCNRFWNSCRVATRLRAPSSLHFGWAARARATAACTSASLAHSNSRRVSPVEGVVGDRRRRVGGGRNKRPPGWQGTRRKPGLLGEVGWGRLAGGHGAGRTISRRDRSGRRGNRALRVGKG